jgi:Domain of unknown function (DUF2017)
MAAVRGRGGRVEVDLEPEERALLLDLVEDAARLLEPQSADDDPLSTLTGISDAPVEAPRGPELARLLPAAYDDEAKAGEFRRLTDLDLRRRKTEALQVLADALRTGRPHRLGADDAERWLQALNDLRLVLGVRLDLRDDGVDPLEQAEAAAADDPRRALWVVYDWLTMLQESLLRCLPE